MIRHQMFVVVGTIIFVAVSQTTARASNFYDVIPVTLSDGYEITGGLIETDISNGPLTSANIVQYSVTVTGPIPFEFTDTNPAAFAPFLINVEVSPAGITVLADSNPGAPGGEANFALSAEDNTIIGCDDCRQSLEWLSFDPPQGSGSAISFSVLDFDDFDPSTGGSLAISNPSQSFLIATPIPEPSTCAMGICAAFGFLLRQRILSLGD